ncbi:MAG: NAD(P)-dependent oxidoreductase [Candidatus Marinimicrobia bacterium]|nr:NAD(P)-dependent oxidoreductase [Candidatus Neomarinimicrobiota bacterium]
MVANITKSTILITGASGFIGRHLVRQLCPDHKIIALGRRTQKDIGIEAHPNLDWILVDLMDEVQLRNAFQKISNIYDLDFIFHLAAYYDFGDQLPSEQYDKTNIQATKTLLELARRAKIKRFIFTSSLVASNFPPPGGMVDENSELDATFPYAITKQIGERFVREASEFFPCTIVRLAAVFSDWCEYEPLYNFLKTWLSKRWDSRIIPGQGSMAIPYVHVSCVIGLFEKILEKNDEIGNFNIFLASSDQPITLMDLFLKSTRCYNGIESTPIYFSPALAKFGVLVRDTWGRIIRKRPFEKMWMMNYLDKQFPTDCSYTRNTLDWHPKSRHQLSRRILHLIENLKSRPDKWHRMNIDRLRRFEGARPALLLAEEMMRAHEELVDKVYTELRLPENKERFSFYQSMKPEDLTWYINVVFNHLLTSVRHGDRSTMITFAQDLSHWRMKDLVSLDELCDVLTTVRDIFAKELYANPKLESMQLLIDDYITLAIQLAIDEIKDLYENIPH